MIMSIRQSATGNWLELKGIIKKQWGRLTDDEITKINGSKEKLLGKLMSKYNMTEEEAEEEVEYFWH